MSSQPPGQPGADGGFTPGQQVGEGRFTLIRFLGKGGMGIVWLAQDSRLDQQVALKFLPPEIRSDPDALDDMRRETVRSIKLSHPNIIRIHDLHEHPNELFIAMEFVDGPTISALKRESPGRVLSWEQARPLLQQLCDALDYAHGENVIHRDLKPANMMVDQRGRLRLADFGIAAVVSDSLSRVSVRSSTSGTMGYMSPQQMNGQRPHPSDDLYALGVTLYELLTSRPPFYTGNIAHQVQEVAPVPMTERLAELEIQNDIPADVGALVMACLAKDPAQRPHSARAVAEWIGLEGWQMETPAPLGEVALNDPAESDAQGETFTETGKRDWRPWVGVALVLVLGLGGLLLWPLAKKSNTRTSSSAVTPGDFRPLFDGRTLDGWQSYAGPSIPLRCKVVNGTITGTVKENIVTKEEFADFEMTFDWKVGARGNGGIFIRVAMKDAPAIPVHAPEFQLIDNAAATVGKPNTRSGSLWAMVPPLVDAAGPVGQWNTGRIVARGPKIEHYINDRLVCSYEIGNREFLAFQRQAGKDLVAINRFAQTPRGPIGLQFLSGEISYRNLRIRPL